ncbi:MAG: UTP--glucose-1-phosphate uridylyltransferase [Clostridia bacterium]|nr:UTP--glucose-1-phosphate uridylyltransferase [Clostridia bacterium]
MDAAAEVRKVVIPVAGLGTRFLPATKSLPKEMLPLLTKPTIQYIVEEAAASGLDDVLFVTGRLKRAIEDHFDLLPSMEVHLASRGREDLLQRVREPAALASFHYVRQPSPLGLGDAVLRARHHVGRAPFAVMLADDVYVADPPAIAQLLRAYREAARSVVAVTRVPRDEVGRYGVVALPPGADPALGRVAALAFVEKPRPEAAPSEWAVVGRYVLEPEIFEILERTGPGAGGEVQLTDALNELARRGRVDVLAVSGERYDVGEPIGFVEATVALALSDPELAPRLGRFLKGLLSADLRPAAARGPGGSAGGTGCA